MSDQEVRDKTGDAAVAAKHAAETAGDAVKKAAETASEKLKAGYDQAAEQGRAVMKDAGAKLSDAALQAKVLAGFKLVAGLDASNVEVEVREGKVYLSGTVPTQLDKWKAEGVAFGVTGDNSKFESTIEVK